jgi:hypothetical protein
MQRNERPLQHHEEQQELSIDSPVSSRASSEPILSLLLQSPTGSPPPPLTKGGCGGGGTTSTGSSSMARYGRSASETISPTSILLTPTTTPEFYAPSRRKRVSFVTEAFLKPPPIQQRLQGMNLADLDLGVSVCRAAVVVAPGAGTATGAAAVEPTQPQEMGPTNLGRHIRILQLLQQRRLRQLVGSQGKPRNQLMF